MLKKGDHVRIRQNAATAYGRHNGAEMSGATAWLTLNAGSEAVVESIKPNSSGEVVITCYDRQQRPVLVECLELVPEGHGRYIPSAQHHEDIIRIANLFRRRLHEDEYQRTRVELADLHLCLPPYLPFFVFEPGDVVFTAAGDRFVREEWGKWRSGKRTFIDDEALLRTWRGHSRWRLLLRKGKLYEGEQPFDN